MLWLVAALIIYVGLWPVMWVEPAKGLAAVRWGITRHATTAHDSPTLFLGQVMRKDPGPLFYGVSLLFRIGEVGSAFLVVAAIAVVTSLLHRRVAPKESARRQPQALVDLSLLSIYAVAYLAQMSLGAKKMPRYILPSLLALDILAAAGVVAWARALGRGQRRVSIALMALPVLIQAALTLPRHPYYGTALNWIAGGPPAAARAILIGEEGEGYVELAGYLNARPDAEMLTVAAQLEHVFSQTFDGVTLEMDEGQGMAQGPADYLAFHRNYIARDYKVGQWGRLWERYAPRIPEREVEFDGVPYAWLYPVLPSDVGPEHAQVAHLGHRFRFLGYDLRELEAASGDRVPVVLYWEATEPVTEDLSIFLHLLSPAGELIWQDDGAGDHGNRPTWSWAPGETIVDPHTVMLPPDLPDGDYVLTTGLYDWQTGERLPVRQLDGTQPNADRVSVATLTIRQPQTRVAAWLARGLALITVFLALVSRVVWPGFRSLDPQDRLAVGDERR
jgi:hypothetical protein